MRIAETEKYAHVTFFFSGGREEPFVGEDRILVPSPKVATYDLQPEMSARQVTDELTAAIASQRFDLIVCNYANGDMVGHTGVFDAAVRAVECLDQCLGRLETALNATGGEMVVTSDHGNVEKNARPPTPGSRTPRTPRNWCRWSTLAPSASGCAMGERSRMWRPRCFSSWVSSSPLK